MPSPEVSILRHKPFIANPQKPGEKLRVDFAVYTIPAAKLTGQVVSGCHLNWKDCRAYNNKKCRSVVYAINAVETHVIRGTTIGEEEERSAEPIPFGHTQIDEFPNCGQHPVVQKFLSDYGLFKNGAVRKENARELFNYAILKASVVARSEIFKRKNELITAGENILHNAKKGIRHKIEDLRHTPVWDIWPDPEDEGKLDRQNGEEQEDIILNRAKITSDLYEEAKETLALCPECKDKLPKDPPPKFTPVEDYSNQHHDNKTISFKRNGDSVNYIITFTNPNTHPVLTINRILRDRSDSFGLMVDFNHIISYTREIAGRKKQSTYNSQWAVKCFRQMLSELSAGPGLKPPGSTPGVEAG